MSQEERLLTEREKFDALRGSPNPIPLQQWDNLIKAQDLKTERIILAHLAHLAQCAPKEVLLTEEEMTAAWNIGRQSEDGTTALFFAKAQLANVWPIAEARIEQAREQGRREINDEIGWRWLGDEEDHLESLSCKVLIEADDIRNLIEQARVEERKKTHQETIDAMNDYSKGKISFERCAEIMDMNFYELVEFCRRKQIGE